jgi:hypothetical protein
MLGLEKLKMADTDISTWNKAKDVLLLGFFGLLTIGVLAIVSLLMDTKKDIAELKISLATFQANSASIDRRVSTLESFKEDHQKEDIQRFQAALVRK